MFSCRLNISLIFFLNIKLIFNSILTKKCCALSLIVYWKLAKKIPWKWYCCEYETTINSTTSKIIPTSHERKPFHNECINSYMSNLRKAKSSQQIMLPGNVNPASQMMSWEIKNHFRIARMSCPIAGDSVTGVKPQAKAVRLCSGNICPSIWTKINVVWVTFWHYGEFNTDENKLSLISSHTGIYKQMPVMQIHWVQTHMPKQFSLCSGI